MILKWAIAFVLFADGVPATRQLLLLDPAEIKTQADCATFVAMLEKEAAKASLGIWAKCVEVDYKPPAKGKPSDKKSEVTS